MNGHATITECAHGTCTARQPSHLRGGVDPQAVTGRFWPAGSQAKPAPATLGAGRFVFREQRTEPRRVRHGFHRHRHDRFAPAGPSRRRRWAWITIATVGLLSASAFLAVPTIAGQRQHASNGTTDDRVVVCESGVDDTATPDVRGDRHPASPTATPLRRRRAAGKVDRLRPRARGSASLGAGRSRGATAGHGSQCESRPEAQGLRPIRVGTPVASGPVTRPRQEHDGELVALVDAVAVGDEREAVRRPRSPRARSTAWSPVLAAT